MMHGSPQPNARFLAFMALIDRTPYPIAMILAAMQTEGKTQ